MSSSFVTLWTATREALNHSHAAAAAKSLQSCPTLRDPIDGSPPGFPSLGFYRQEHWSGLPFPSPGDLPDPGIELGPPAFQVDSLPTKLTEKQAP